MNLWCTARQAQGTTGQTMTTLTRFALCPLKGELHDLVFSKPDDDFVRGELKAIHVRHSQPGLFVNNCKGAARNSMGSQEVSDRDDHQAFAGRSNRKDVPRIAYSV